MSFFQELSKIVKGEVDVFPQTLDRVSHDASIFEVKPKALVKPIDSEDIKALVNYASNNKGVSITVRSAGTDMSGGPLGESIILDMTAHFDQIKEVRKGKAITQPGVYYREFDKATIAHGGQILPSYPASRELCTVGGMVANNSAGEKTLTYGQTERYVKRLKMICADGKEYEFSPLTIHQLEQHKKFPSFESEIYRKMHDLIITNKDLIEKARPTVSKNSCGYFLWNVEYEIDSSNGKPEKVFDLTKLIVGSQGTLGIITEIEFALVKPKPHSRLLVILLKDIQHLGMIAKKVLEYKPESFESYDDHTFKVALRFLPTLLRRMKGSFITTAFRFIPEMLTVLRGGVPKLVLMAEFTGDSEDEALKKVNDAYQALQAFDEGLRVLDHKHEKIFSRITKNDRDAEKYWVIRRESFNMLRQHAKNLRTAPFIDDFVVNPEKLPEFLPRLYKILDEYKSLTYTIAGHIGDGNFHIIPLMDLHDFKSHKIIEELSVKVYTLVHEYEGSIAGEHNDGIIRTPFVKMQYGDDMYRLFEQVKKIWDPKGIFNPGKKVGGTLEYAFRHIVK